MTATKLVQYDGSFQVEEKNMKFNLRAGSETHQRTAVSRARRNEVGLDVRHAPPSDGNVLEAQKKRRRHRSYRFGR